ncbi:uncharacterized protein LOC119684711 [Teleopsis dalmanni]|uniref:uncharacterized protein LOC119684711 n=2 Tax=Teleopsis dalmanni TaxID=139649 RepID=UPI0018CDABEC|nr:uncharacterized protein LOC119684711 [Teleopsis dalmanni]
MAEGEIPEETRRYPVHLNTFRIPDDEKLLTAYNVYQATPQTIELKSERYRELFPDVFLLNKKLGTLADICVTTLAREYGPKGLDDSFKDDPLKCRIFYDSLDIETALEKCYFVQDEGFWRRLVLAKSEDKSLIHKESVDWRGLGASLKFVELVEACPSEYWPKDEMQPLALLIKDFVTDMHISRLQALEDGTLMEHIDSDLSETESESDISTTSESEVPYEDENAEEEKTVEQLEMEKAKAELRLERKRNHEARREAIRLKKEARERQYYGIVIPEEEVEEEPPPAPVKKKKKKKAIKDVFEIEIEEEEDDHENEFKDKRNIGKALEKDKGYKYPPKHCNHINLSFIRFFDNLVSFQIEFQGPRLGRNYHTKYFQFSYEDVKNLGRGLYGLKALKIFRLRNSRMNSKKLNILLKTLIVLQDLEVLDFGYDQLQDDCLRLSDLLQFTKNVKSIELEGNYLGPNVMEKFGEALEDYKGVVEYVGLAANPLEDAGLHSFVSAIIGTEQVSKLCLNGIEVSQSGISCCIADELLACHKPLQELDFKGVQIEWDTSEDIMRALVKNQKISNFDCRGCGLEFEIEFEIEVIMRRNKYIQNNPYIGNENETKESILEFARSVKNPSLLEAMKYVEDRMQCLAKRPNIYEPKPPIRPSSVYFDVEEDDSYFAFRHLDKQEEDFKFDPNEFNKEEFLEHVNLPGPEERYYFFKVKKEEEENLDY